MKYLIVDDNTKFRHLLREQICHNGDLVKELDDGTNVLKTYRSFNPDWVLMDIQMKKRNGFETTKELKEAFPKAHVIIVSNHTDKPFERKAYKVGADGFVPKDKLYTISDIIKKQKKVNTELNSKSL